MDAFAVRVVEHTGARPVVGAVVDGVGSDGAGSDGVGSFRLRLQEFGLGLSCRTCISRSGEWQRRAGLTPTGSATG